MNSHPAIFKGKQIRKTIHNTEWWFSVVDVVEVLTNSVNPRDYWYKMKIRVKDASDIELSTICRQLKLESSDGKNMKLTNVGEDREYAILTAEISKATFGLTPSEYKKLESETKQKVVSSGNYLYITQKELKQKKQQALPKKGKG